MITFCQYVTERLSARREPSSKERMLMKNITFHNFTIRVREVVSRSTLK